MLEYEFALTEEQALTIDLDDFWWDGTGHGVIPDHEKELITQLITLQLGYKPDITFRPYHDHDWIGEQQQALPPITIRPFYIYGPHHKETPPPNTLPLLVDATHAFGSGHHPTTRTCLEIIASLPTITNMLDVGSGSGVLSKAAHALHNCRTTTCDTETPADTDSIDHPLIAQNSPYDLICANIHLNTLTDLAPKLLPLASHYILLSGILEEQTELLLNAYPTTTVHTTTLDGWTTILLN